jgi:chromosome segregation ATPase
VSLLTKTLVVLVTFLSILMVALVVPYVAQTENLRDSLTQAERAEREAQIAAELARSEANLAANRTAEQLAALRADKTELQSNLRNIERSVDDLAAENRQLASQNSQLAASVTTLTTTTDASTQLLDRTLNDLKTATSDRSELKTQTIQLADTVNEKESQIESLKRQVRRIRETTSALVQRNEELAARLDQVPPEFFADAETGQAMAGEVVPDQPILGEVSDVADAAGEMLVEVNVGSEDRVQQNMRFLVHRGSEYLGTLIIDKVDRSNAVGRVVLRSEDAGTIQPSDKVYAGRF